MIKVARRLNTKPDRNSLISELYSPSLIAGIKPKSVREKEIRWEC